MHLAVTLKKRLGIDNATIQIGTDGATPSTLEPDHLLRCATLWPCRRDWLTTGPRPRLARQSLHGLFPLGFSDRPKVDRRCLDRWVKGGRPPPANLTPHMPGHRIQAGIPAMERKPTPQLRAVDDTGMTAVRTLGAEVEVRDAQLVESVDGGDQDSRGNGGEGRGSDKGKSDWPQFRPGPDPD